MDPQQTPNQNGNIPQGNNGADSAPMPAPIFSPDTGDNDTSSNRDRNNVAKFFNHRPHADASRLDANMPLSPYRHDDIILNNPNLAQAQRKPRKKILKTVILVVVILVLLAGILGMSLWFFYSKNNIDIDELRNIIRPKIAAIENLESFLNFSLSQATVGSYIEDDSSATQSALEDLKQDLSIVENLNSELSDYESVTGQIVAGYNASDELAGLKSSIELRIPIYREAVALATTLLEAFNSDHTDFAEKFDQYGYNEDMSNAVKEIQRQFEGLDAILDSLSKNQCHDSEASTLCASLFNDYAEHRSALYDNASVISNLYALVVNKGEAENAKYNPMIYINPIMHNSEGDYEG